MQEYMAFDPYNLIQILALMRPVFYTRAIVKPNWNKKRKKNAKCLAVLHWEIQARYSAKSM